jgi:hypothetical protein
VIYDRSSFIEFPPDTFTPSVAKGVFKSVDQSEFFYIYFFSQFWKNIWSLTNLAKIYICRRGPRRQGLNAVALGAQRHGV